MTKVEVVETLNELRAKAETDAHKHAIDIAIDSVLIRSNKEIEDFEG